MILTPVILAGGNGTRLWPLSRTQHPKQYLSLIEEQSMLQATIQRLSGLESVIELEVTDPIVICNHQHRFLVAEQLQQIGIKNPTILLETEGKNSAPAIATAAYYSQLTTDDCQLLILPADHLIQDIQEFHQAINIAIKQAQQEKLVTFGITPTEANTGYGYIEKADNSYNIKQFIEKPDQKTADLLIQNDNYLWNSGMFLFTSQNYLQELKQHAPQINQASKQAVTEGTEERDFYYLAPFPENLEPLSIDYAVMEKTNNAVVIPLNAGWSDIGNWKTLWEVGVKDNNNNVIKGDVTTINTTNSYINADHHMIAIIGIDNLIIIDTPDATLVAHKDQAQQVKEVVAKLKSNKKSITATHRKVYRPWGWYDVIDKEKRFKVKRICVNPGSSLSLQKHHHRAEHWIVVKGTAQITNDGKTELLTENQSTYIPVGVKHRLENPGKLPLEMIEVQSGGYLGEDDIERYEDSYGREEK